MLFNIYTILTYKEVSFMRNQDNKRSIIKSAISLSIASCMILSSSMPILADIIPTDPYSSITYTSSESNKSTNIIPDEKFKAIINSELGRPEDMDITKKDIKKLKSLDASYSDISDTTGIQYAVNLTYLDLSGNNLISIKLPNSTSLKSLYIYENQLTSIDLSNLPSLINLDISDNNITTIDLSLNLKLSKINLSYNQLSKLDLQSNSAINQLYASNNKIANFISPDKQNTNARFDISNQMVSYDNISNVNRSALFINPVKYNQESVDPDSISNNGNYDEDMIGWSELPADISSVFFKFDLQQGKLNYSGKVSLNLVDGSSQPTNVIPDLNFKQVLNRQLANYDLYAPISSTEMAAFTSIYAYDKNIQSAQGIEHATNLEQLNLSSNQLTTIDISHNTKLVRVELDFNKLDGIDISKNTKLDYLSLQDTNLKDIDTSNNTKLKHLNLNYNVLTTIDLSTNTLLTSLSLNNNNLKNLNLESNSKLKNVYANNNYIRNINYDESIVTKNKAKLDLSNQTISYTDIPKLDGNVSFENIVYHNSNPVAPNGISNNGSYDTSGNTLNWTDLASEVNQVSFNFELGLQGGKYSGKVDLSLTEQSPETENVVPDDNFRKVINEQLGKSDLLAPVTAQEMSTITSLDASDKQIKSAQGIEYAVDLEFLQLAENQLTSIDFGGIKAIEYLNLSSNELTDINISNMTNMISLMLMDNQLQSIDLSNNFNISTLNIQYNKLKTMYFPNRSNLRLLYGSNNELESIDVSNAVNLEILQLDENLLSFIDLSNNTKLTSLSIDNNNLTSIDLSNNTMLTYISLDKNQLTNIKFPESNVTMIGNLFDQNISYDIPVINNGIIFDSPIFINDEVLTPATSSVAYEMIDNKLVFTDIPNDVNEITLTYDYYVMNVKYSATITLNLTR